MTTQIGDRAIVVGASIAGLLAARVLSEAYAQVMVVDHDHLPGAAAPRRCVPQARHTHVLIERGQQVLEELFPGFTADLVAQGVPTLDNLRDVRWCLSGHRLPQPESGMTVVSASRPFLEGYVRARVSALPGITLMDRCDVAGLTTTPDRRRVTGVRVLRRADGSAGEILDADLVVDAAGRGSRTPTWLAELGFAALEEERVQVGLGYATRIYRAPAPGLGDDLGVVIGPTPDNPRGGALQMLEGNRFLVTLMGMLGDYPPTDPDGFLDFARTLPIPDLGDTIRDAEPLEKIRSFRFPASVRRRYERLSRFPTGLLVTGDGLCSFNPIYAQGMTVAALEALTLRRHLHRGTAPHPRAFFRDAAKAIDVPWDMSTGADLAFPEVIGARGPKVRLGNAYIPRLHAAAAHDPVLATTFIRVAALVDHPGRLMSPGTVLRVLRQHLPGPARPAHHHAPDQVNPNGGVNAP
ncbi:FAD-binding monooxygenase [Rhodococcus opacus]|uniref:FAD-dependent oxidoreductase n=1 Tax=Rhodococcus opacus TaxID=37919 RepID=UPI0002A3C4DF|nr:hypothetical protein [Rhodococcus opacus]ELB89891.1 hypothetical protein Rwratislav_27149 [Rhodococcus wratislaviensis IFP 2016]MDX5970043.1 FAD-binding monooxygenase [Rhodococcus opacus]CAG7634477.1 putative protein [Rhodococcus opacus]